MNLRAKRKTRNYKTPRGVTLLVGMQIGTAPHGEYCDEHWVGSGWGKHVNPWLIHVNVWQKPLQYCN